MNIGHMSEELQGSCGKAPLDAVTCMDCVKRYANTSSDDSQVPLEQFCQEVKDTDSLCCLVYTHTTGMAAACSHAKDKY
ncbi:hypothetical protein Baya_9979 [Bagarius yarrelli]|uniref:Uncharacterized protein n=1 Tax=Bagarius yarrelli TaxID=175774 RepID=A0A556U856_BAGYA|nr:hypothetical protein Baya_9979 [Bagarius yarrelli]